jgi:hypothetical protein
VPESNDHNLQKDRSSRSVLWSCLVQHNGNSRQRYILRGCKIPCTWLQVLAGGKLTCASENPTAISKHSGSSSSLGGQGFVSICWVLKGLSTHLSLELNIFNWPIFTSIETRISPYAYDSKKPLPISHHNRCWKIVWLNLAHLQRMSKAFQSTKHLAYTIISFASVMTPGWKIVSGKKERWELGHWGQTEGCPSPVSQFAHHWMYDG